MLGIENVASYLPDTKVDNFAFAEKFGLDATFIENKIGVLERRVKDSDEDTSDMALKALNALLQKTGETTADIQALVVVTQNPDYNIPHVSGLVHAKAELSESCATFDISLGCSGYVYGLSIITAFMAAAGLTKGVLITADPYTKIIDPNDKNTVLLFGDAATATFIGPKPIYENVGFAFGSRGDLKRALICENNVLEMNGRDVFNFAATTVPGIVSESLEKADISVEDVGAFLFHQGSGYILDTLARRMKLDPTKVVKGLAHTGNTVSSSIPLLLDAEIDGTRRKNLMLCGFGVGLSYASCVCKLKE